MRKVVEGVHCGASVPSRGELWQGWRSQGLLLGSCPRMWLWARGAWFSFGMQVGKDFQVYLHTQPAPGPFYIYNHPYTFVRLSKKNTSWVISLIATIWNLHQFNYTGDQQKNVLFWETCRFLLWFHLPKFWPLHFLGLWTQHWIPICGEIGRVIQCTFCHSLLHNTHQANCGHHFCQHCILFLRELNSVPIIPIAKVFKSQEVFKDNCFRREVLNLYVHCKDAWM